MTSRPQPPPVAPVVQGQPFRAQVAHEGPESGGRHAALLVHSMGPSDREWLLGHLDAADRASLDGMLFELETLGIPPDGALIEQALGGLPDVAEARGAAPAAAAPAPSSPEEAVAAAPAAAIADLLRHEPPGLVAALLAAGDWPWRAAVMAELDVYQRRRLEERLPRGSSGADAAAAGPAVPPALAKQLVQALAGRLQRWEPGARAARPTRGGRWTTLARAAASLLGLVGLAVRREGLP